MMMPVTFFPAQGLFGQIGAQRGINSARQPDDYAGEPRFRHDILDKTDEQFLDELDVDLELRDRRGVIRIRNPRRTPGPVAR